MPSNLELVPSHQETADEQSRFDAYLERLHERMTPEEREEIGDVRRLSEVITEETPLVYWSMEFYDREENDIKAAGGLGVLAADIRRQCAELELPMIVKTPYYTEESHQKMDGFRQTEELVAAPEPTRLHRRLGSTAIRTLTDVKEGILKSSEEGIELDINERRLGSTRIQTVTKEDFGQLYPGGNSGDERLRQEAALGFGGYQSLKEQGIEAPFMQLNEAPTVFAALARLDDLVANRGMAFEDAFGNVRNQFIFTNHTLVPAVEGEFSRSQFGDIVTPNIQSDEVRDWLWGVFGERESLKLSVLANDMCDAKTGVSVYHARIASEEFKGRWGEDLHYEAVTNGISRKWIISEAMDYYSELGALDEFDLPTEDFQDRLEQVDVGRVREIKRLGRAELNDVLARRSTLPAAEVQIPEDAVVFNYNRRIADYKRLGLAFNDPDQLADILNENNGYLLISGKAHPSDEPMKDKLEEVLNTAAEHPGLRDRVVFIEDYDEEIGRALSVGSDIAINVPVVGREACGTSFMKVLANFGILVSTKDGGVADVDNPHCLIVEGKEEESIYDQMRAGAAAYRDEERYRQLITGQLKDYLPIVSGSRMIGGYVKLFSRLLKQREMALTEVAEAA